LGKILRFLRLEVSVYNVYFAFSNQFCSKEGGGEVKSVSRGDFE
jgi:hypothetical protein